MTGEAAVSLRALILLKRVIALLKTEVKTYSNYIDGEWVESVSGKTFDNTNPADTNDIVGRFQASTEEDAQNAVKAAQNAFEEWAALAPSKRAAYLNKAADILEENAEQYGEELTREEGKIIGAGRMEVKKSAQTLRFYAVQGQTLTGETFPNDDPKMSVYTKKEPLGVATVITPWNFPISIPARKIAPALITGNTVVFKCSSDAPMIAYRLAEAFHEAGIPHGVLNFITGSASQVGPAIVEDPVVRAISFTGSTGAGEHIHRSVALTTRTQMELGGKNPVLVMEDADLDLAADITMKGGFNLTGQACTGTSRVLVMKSQQKAFVDKLVEKAKSMKIGNGMKDGVQIGPLANEKQLNTVLDYVKIGKEEATHVYGGDRLSGSEYDNGFFVTPAVFTDVTQDMRIAREEIFGPVVAVIGVESYEEAVRLANDVEYGLSASIVTNNIELAQRFTGDIQAGTVKVNRTTTGNLMNAPFGGLKKSSTSTFRESGKDGLEIFTQTKTVYVGY